MTDRHNESFFFLLFFHVLVLFSLLTSPLTQFLLPSLSPENKY